MIPNSTDDIKTWNSTAKEFSKRHDDLKTEQTEKSHKFWQLA